MPMFVSSIQLFQRVGYVRQREEELRVNGPEEVFAALCGRVAEIEVIVEMRDPSIERVFLEMINHV